VGGETFNAQHSTSNIEGKTKDCGMDSGDSSSSGIGHHSLIIGMVGERWGAFNEIALALATVAV
jgi:hypothetical protein